jgi:hypothetical protein
MWSVCCRFLGRPAARRLGKSGEGLCVEDAGAPLVPRATDGASAGKIGVGLARGGRGGGGGAHALEESGGGGARSCSVLRSRGGDLVERGEKERTKRYGTVVFGKNVDKSVFLVD